MADAHPSPTAGSRPILGPGQSTLSASSPLAICNSSCGPRSRRATSCTCSLVRASSLGSRSSRRIAEALDGPVGTRRSLVRRTGGADTSRPVLYVTTTLLWTSCDSCGASSGNSQTAGNYYGGRLEFRCLYDEFGLDNPLNRILRPPPVSSSPASYSRLRCVAGPGEYLPGWMASGAAPIRPEGASRSPHRPLPRRDHTWRATSSFTREDTRRGASPAWTFLIRTPLMVEAGSERFFGRHGQEAGRNWHPRRSAANLTFSPDLVFDGGSSGRRRQVQGL